MLVEASAVLSQPPLRRVIPRQFLWGSQPKTEYCHSSRRRVDAELRRFGIRFLEENPPIVFAQEKPVGTTRLVIYDGHHRVRIAPRHGIHNIPCSIYTPEQLYIHNQKLYPKEFICSFRSFIEMLDKRILWTLESFRDLPDHKQPHYFNGRISDLTGLPGF